MKRSWVVLALVALAACLPLQSAGRFFGGSALPPREPSRAALLAAGTAADDARALAFATLVPGALAPAFADAALDELRAAVAHLRRHGQRIERRLDGRTLVHSVAAGAVAEGVLAISGWERLDDQAAAGTWRQFIEQWEFRLGWHAGWRVVAEAVLPPDIWWP